MHVQQQFFNICNTAIVGNYRDKNNFKKGGVRYIYKSIKLISQNHR